MNIPGAAISSDDEEEHFILPPQSPSSSEDDEEEEEQEQEMQNWLIVNKHKLVFTMAEQLQQREALLEQKEKCIMAESTKSQFVAHVCSMAFTMRQCSPRTTAPSIQGALQARTEPRLSPL